MPRTRKRQKEEIEYRPADPRGWCDSCQGIVQYIRRLPRGDWICMNCNPYAAMEIQLHSPHEKWGPRVTTLSDPGR